MKVLLLFGFLATPFLLLSQASQKPKERPIATAAFSTMNLPGSPDFLAVDGDDVWISNIDRVEKLSVKSKTPTLKVAVPGACGALIVGFDAIWVASCTEQMIYRINNKTGKIIAKILCGVSDTNGEIMLAVGGGSVWALSDSTGILTRIDPRTNTIQAKIPVLPGSYCAVYGYDAIWVSNTNLNSVQRIDPKTNRVLATIPVGKTPRFIAAGEDGVWTLNQEKGTVSRIDPGSNKVVAEIDTNIPGTGGDIATGAGLVWVRGKSQLLQTINPKSNTIETIYTPVAGSGAVRTTDHFIWVTAHDINTIWILKP